MNCLSCSASGMTAPSRRRSGGGGAGAGGLPAAGGGAQPGGSGGARARRDSAAGLPGPGADGGLGLPGQYAPGQLSAGGWGHDTGHAGGPSQPAWAAVPCFLLPSSLTGHTAPLQTIWPSKHRVRVNDIVFTQWHRHVWPS